MKRIFLLFAIFALIISCQDNKTEATSAGAATTPESSKTPADLPYTASYSSNFTTDVSDADLKTVLMSYKDWADGNLANLSKEMADSIMVEFNDGRRFNGTNDSLMKMWKTYRDSLSSVTIDMIAWQKMHEPTKNESAILTWYKEIDTYKNGKVDSAYYHDVNGIKNGRITFYSQYKRPAK
jgi:hypothetical protein